MLLPVVELGTGNGMRCWGQGVGDEDDAGAGSPVRWMLTTTTSLPLPLTVYNGGMSGIQITIGRRDYALVDYLLIIGRADSQIP